jgi:serine/threonine protein kinase
MPAPNTLLYNRYLIVAEIARGGMGAVYKAIDQTFGSTIALKECFFSDNLLRKAFEREARMLNRLRHATLPVVFDYFTEGDRQFLAMQFIPGDDLGELLEKRKKSVEPKGEPKPFTLAEVLQWADDLLDALDYLHTQQPPIIHRDIKPQNMKLTSRGEIVLLDFGLAKGLPLSTAHITSSGSIFGYTPSYAPLEQIQGSGTDPRSDLYSVAATLYHLITGVTPVDALARAAAIVEDQPDPLKPANKMNPHVPVAVASILAQAMAQNRNHRPATAAKMREVLREAAKDFINANSVNLAMKPGAPATAIRSEQLTELIYSAAPQSARPVGLSRAQNDPSKVASSFKPRAKRLSSYSGKIEGEGRHYRRIGLIILALFPIGILFLYLFHPSTNSWINGLVSQMRGRNQAALQPPPAPEYKAQVYLARGQISNNNSLAKARGRVTNISDTSLENLFVEVELIRKDGAPPDIRTAPVNPSTLAPTQQGIFEVDLDSRVHSGHRLSRLLSKDGEVTFTAPGPTLQPAE